MRKKPPDVSRAKVGVRPKCWRSRAKETKRTKSTRTLHWLLSQAIQQKDNNQGSRATRGFETSVGQRRWPPHELHYDTDTLLPHWVRKDMHGL